MGLFDFIKDYGKKIFSSDEDTEVASSKIKEEIESDNPGIEDLNVSKDEEGNVTITGTAASEDAMQKAVLMAGNIQGVTNVIASEVVVAQGADEVESVSVEYYTIVKGDTLWAIATKFYGNGAKYTKIVEDNLEVIKDADKIYPGQKIRIVK
jgi:nucleoid-associated protein YgaU